MSVRAEWVAGRHLGQKVGQMPSGARDEALTSGTFRKPRAIFGAPLPAAAAGIRDEVEKTGNVLQRSHDTERFARRLVQSQSTV